MLKKRKDGGKLYLGFLDLEKAHDRVDREMSPTLFSSYTGELVARMRRMNAGVRVGNDRIGVLLYVDDVVVMSESAKFTLVDSYGVRFS